MFAGLISQGFDGGILFGDLISDISWHMSNTNLNGMVTIDYSLGPSLSFLETFPTQSCPCKRPAHFNFSTPRPRSLLCGKAADVAEDAFHVARTRLHLRGMPLGDLSSMDPMNLFNQNEVERLHTYVQKWSQSSTAVCCFEDLMVHLGDNPKSEKGWTTWSAKSLAIPTLRRAGGLYASPCAQRQLLLRELYAGMGFPTFPELAKAALVPIYQVFRPTAGLWYSHMRQALGNSQHVASVGVFTACALASSCKRDWKMIGNADSYCDIWSAVSECIFQPCQLIPWMH